MADSPFSTDSNVDVTAYAGEMVQRMEAALTVTQSEVEVLARDVLGVSHDSENLPTTQFPESRRTRRPRLTMAILKLQACPSLNQSCR